jgi:hypothetical protein
LRSRRLVGRTAGTPLRSCQPVILKKTFWDTAATALPQMTDIFQGETTGYRHCEGKPFKFDQSAAPNISDRGSLNFRF